MKLDSAIVLSSVKIILNVGLVCESEDQQPESKHAAQSVKSAVLENFQ